MANVFLTFLVSFLQLSTDEVFRGVNAIQLYCNVEEFGPSKYDLVNAHFSRFFAQLEYAGAERARGAESWWSGIAQRFLFFS